MSVSLSGCARSPFTPAFSLPPPEASPLPAPTPHEERPASVAQAEAVARAAGPTPSDFMARVRRVAGHTAAAVKGHATFLKKEGAELVSLRVGCAYIKQKRLKGPADEFFARLVPSTPGASSFRRSAAEDRLGKLEMKEAGAMAHRTEAERSLGAMLGTPDFAKHLAQLSVGDRLALATDLARAADGTPAAKTIAGWISAGLRGEGPIGDLRSILAREPSAGGTHDGHGAHGAHAHHAELAHSFLVAAMPSVAAAGTFYNLVAEHGHLPGLRASNAIKVGGAFVAAFAAMAHLQNGGLGGQPAAGFELAKSGVEVAEVVAEAKHAHALAGALSRAAGVLGVAGAVAQIAQTPVDSSNAQLLANAGRLAGYALALLNPGTAIIAMGGVLLSELVALFGGNSAQPPAEGALSKMGLCAQKAD